MTMVRVGLLCMLLGLPFSVTAAEFKIKMLTDGPNASKLVFDPMFLKVKNGDTVTFVPVDQVGHTSISLVVPAGATPWKAAPNAPISVKLDKSGVYLVECDLHKSMGMVAVIQVGKPTNLAEAKQKAAEESKHMLANKDRYDKLLAMVK